MVLKIDLKRLIIFIILLSAFLDLSAQKVKYKDLFVLLSANDFGQAEPFLRRYMAQEPDDPNANMYMGRMFESKFHEKDILKETEFYTAYCDSAVFYYRKAYGLIDEKEIKKNDEFYQEYSRRDLRTGKFGVKLADVQFDLEKRIGEIEKLSTNAKSLKKSFNSFVTNYTRAESLYHIIVEKFRELTMLLLKNSDADLDSLTKMGEYFEKFSMDFKDYKQTLSSITGSNYGQRLSTKFLEGFKKLDSPDFYSNNVVVYDFKSWDDEIHKVIVEDIRPMKENMKVYDKQLDDLYRQVSEEGKSAENELASLTKKMFFEQLNNYDSNPLPSLIFNYKVIEISYYSSKNNAKNEGLLDSVNFDLQAKIYNTLYIKFQSLENAYNPLTKINAKEESDLYSDYVIDRFKGVTGLVNYISRKGEQINREKSNLEGTLEELNEKSKWALYHNDSIPLIIPDKTHFLNLSSDLKYRTLTVDSIVDGYEVAGLRLNSEKKIESFASKIGFDRIVDTIFFHPIKPKTQIDTTTKINGWSKSYVLAGDNTNGFIYVYKMSTGSNVNSSFEILNVQPKTGYKWSTAFEHPATVLDVHVDTGNGLIVLKMGIIAQDGTSAETDNLVFNFNGAIMTSQND